MIDKAKLVELIEEYGELMYDLRNLRTYRDSKKFEEKVKDNIDIIWNEIIEILQE